MVISHRGGASVHPEESLHALSESAAAGFYPEFDIRFLSDGTPVLLHDTTTERTMEGVSGPVSELSPEQWQAGRITHPHGGEPEPAVFLETALDELGGEIVLVPEIKRDASPDDVDRVLDHFSARNLEGSILVQSFDYETCVQIAEAGWDTLFLVGGEADVEPERLLNDGIEWIGPSLKMSAEDMEEYADAGLRVVPYTLETSTDATTLPDSVFGYFTDDPWS